MKDKINLRSRGGIKNWLEKIEDKSYVLHSEFDHIRFGYLDASMKEIQFADPPGGPFMSVGDELVEADNAEISSIKFVEGKGTVITFV